MIEITIKHHIKGSQTVDKNLVVKRTPTQIVDESVYGNRSEKKVAYLEEYQVVKVEESTVRDYTLLRQEIPLEKEASFDLQRVIRAINGLEEEKAIPARHGVSG